MMFDLPEIEKGCPATGKQGRRHPIIIWNNSYGKDEVRFNVPDGYEVYYLPEATEIRNQYFEFQQSYRQEGQRIFYQGEFVRKAARISPEEFASYQKYCQTVGKSFNQSVLFRKKR